MEKGILGMVVQHLPSPQMSQESKVSVICPAFASDHPKYPEIIDDKTLVEWRELKLAV